MAKKFFLGAAITAGAGLILVIVLTVISGVQYRTAENQGLEPGGAPVWIVVTTNVGVLLLVLGLVAMAAVGVKELLRRMVDHRSS